MNRNFSQQDGSDSTCGRRVHAVQNKTPRANFSMFCLHIWPSIRSRARNGFNKCVWLLFIMKIIQNCIAKRHLACVQNGITQLGDWRMETWQLALRARCHVSIRQSPSLCNAILNTCPCLFAIQFWIIFIIRGRKSSHPAALSLKLNIILYISSSVTVDAKNFSDISNLMYSPGHLLVEGISLAKDSPTFTKKILNLLAIIFPSLITSPLYLNFELTGQYFRLLMIDLPGFLYIGFVLLYQILVVLAFSRA